MVSDISEKIIEGDLVIAFNDKAWSKTGDIDNNSIYYQEAIVKTIRQEINGTRIVADVMFLKNKIISRGHFLRLLKKK